MATAFATALLAVIVFVLTQGSLKLVLEPVQAQRVLVGEVAAALTVYEKAHTLKNEPGPIGFVNESILFDVAKEESVEAERVLRGLAGRLRASLWTVPFYDLFALFRIIPKMKGVVVAADELHVWYSQLSSPVHEHQVERIRECRNIIAKSLGIEQRLQVVRLPFIESEAEVFPPSVERGD